MAAGIDTPYTSPPYRSQMAGEYLAWNHGIRPQNRDNGPALTSLLRRIRQGFYKRSSARIWFEPAPYKFRTAVTDAYATVSSGTVECMGSGTGATYLQADGPLLAAGDLLTPGRYFHAYNMTIGATAQKTAGALVKVIGDMLVTETPSKRLMAYQFGNVCLENGFDGFRLEDGGANKSVCGFFWDGGHAEAHGFAAGGTVFYCDTGNGAGSPHGGVVISVQNMTHYETAGVADGSRPDATFRIRGVADLRLYHCESFYARRACVIDPPASARVNTVFMTSCIWGATTQRALHIDPNATAESAMYQMVGGYVDSGGIYLGPNAKAFYGSGIVLSGNTTAGVDLDGCSGVTLTGIMGAGANNRVIWAHNNAKNFTIDGSMRGFGGNNTTGVEIAAGSDKYKVHFTGGEYCTTPKSAPVDDATKTCSVF